MLNRTDAGTETLRPAFTRSLGRSGAIALIAFWLERSRSRRALAGLNDHELRDVGLTRQQARRESALPFWRP